MKNDRFSFVENTICKFKTVQEVIQSLLLVTQASLTDPSSFAVITSLLKLGHRHRRSYVGKNQRSSHVTDKKKKKGSLENELFAEVIPEYQ